MSPVGPTEAVRIFFLDGIVLNLNAGCDAALALKKKNAQQVWSGEDGTQIFYFIPQKGE